MNSNVKTRGGRILIVPDTAEDKKITLGALSDPDAKPLSNQQIKRLKRKLAMGHTEVLNTGEKIPAERAIGTLQKKGIRLSSMIYHQYLMQVLAD